ncbi:MAG: HEAT repeat domain-containing protein, partial [Pyrinomonadaceae bacterium]
MYKINLVKFSVIGLACVLCLVTFEAGDTQANDKDITSYSMAETTTLHEPVIIYFNVSNVMTQPLKIDLGRNSKGAFRLAVTDPDGNRAQISSLDMPREGISFSGLVTLDPGESFKKPLVLNEWCEFSKVGKYLIELELNSTLQTLGGEIVPATRKFSANLKVTPRDTERLKNICESLVQQVLASTSYQQSAEAAATLSYVKDPIAVRYLEKVLESHKMVEQYAITGLRRVGNSDAVHILISTIEKQERETA